MTICSMNMRFFSINFYYFTLVTVFPAALSYPTRQHLQKERKRLDSVLGLSRAYSYSKKEKKFCIGKFLLELYIPAIVSTKSHSNIWAMPITLGGIKEERS